VPIGLGQARKVIRMEASLVAQFFNSSVVLPKYSKTCGDEFDLAHRICGRHKPRNTVDDQAEIVLIQPEGILGALPVVNVGQQHVPAGDTALRVSRGQSPRLEPAVHAISTPLAEFKS